MLAMPDFSNPFIIQTDASGIGLGAILIQDQLFITFYGHTLGTQARPKSIYENELMAICNDPYQIIRVFNTFDQV